MAAKAKLPNKSECQYAFQATRGRWSVDEFGEAQLVLKISAKESIQMSSLSKYSGRLLQVAVIVLPPDTKVEENNEDEE